MQFPNKAYVVYSMLAAALCTVSAFAQSADGTGAADGGTTNSTVSSYTFGSGNGNPSGGGTDMGNSIAGTTGDLSGTAGNSMGSETDSTNTADNTLGPATAENPSGRNMSGNGGYATSASGGSSG